MEPVCGYFDAFRSLSYDSFTAYSKPSYTQSAI